MGGVFVYRRELTRSTLRLAERTVCCAAVSVMSSTSLSNRLEEMRRQGDERCHAPGACRNSVPPGHIQRCWCYAKCGEIPGALEPHSYIGGRLIAAFGRPNIWPPSKCGIAVACELVRGNAQSPMYCQARQDLRFILKSSRIARAVGGGAAGVTQMTPRLLRRGRCEGFRRLGCETKLRLARRRQWRCWGLAT